MIVIGIRQVFLVLLSRVIVWGAYNRLESPVFLVILFVYLFSLEVDIIKTVQI